MWKGKKCGEKREEDGVRTKGKEETCDRVNVIVWNLTEEVHQSASYATSFRLRCWSLAHVR
jgi:hypothetical protein